MNPEQYQKPGNDYDHLSFHDLVDARDAYHVHLMNRPHVVATAVGRYRIRVEDSWPDADGNVKHKGTGRRTLANSEVRPYSWPAILVFIDEWVEASKFGKEHYHADDMVPRTLYLPDGRKIPVCVVLVEKVAKTDQTVGPMAFPLNNIGGGNPVYANVQGREHAATIACLVTDGHRTYALTNRHVAGDAGEILYSKLNGCTEPIGHSSGKQLTRVPFSEVEVDTQASQVFINLDAGLIDIDDLTNWTAQVHGIGTIGRLADFSSASLRLSLVGCRVVGIGAVSGRMEGEICALLYRYKAVGGFEYLADFLIGPRTGHEPGETSRRRKASPELLTRPGDSGSLWMLDPLPVGAVAPKNAKTPPEYRPFGLQWGQQVFNEPTATSYVLATSLSSVCRLLDLDVVRDWNIDQVDTWGAIGHFSIAASVAEKLTDAALKNLMTKNADVISPSKDSIRSNDFKGMGDAPVVPLADVPDMFWKPRIAHQGAARRMEGPNHFADMDQPDADGDTLLTLTEDDSNIDPKVWNDFYESVRDLQSGEEIAPEHRGLLPFRVWQIFNDMVRFVKAGKAPEFVCAAGVLTHYIGDACQPLHISYLHDGDPEQKHQVSHRRAGVPTLEDEIVGLGVHSAYEDDMVNAHRGEILDGIGGGPKLKASELILTGFEAAKRTIGMMRGVFQRLPPREIVEGFAASSSKGKQLADELWAEFDKRTIDCMRDGAHLLAVLWQSAWVAGGAEQTIPASAIKAITGEKAMQICKRRTFLPSFFIDQISDELKKPV